MNNKILSKMRKYIYSILLLAVLISSLVLPQTVFALPQDRIIQGEGSQTEGTYAGGGSAGNYTDLNSLDDSTSYLEVSALGTYHHSYNMQDFNTPVLSIDGVTVTFRTRENGAGDTAYVRIGGVNYYGTQHSGGTEIWTTYTENTFDGITNKNPATGLAWDTTALNNAEFGVRLYIASGGRYVDITYMKITVDYTPPTVPTVTTSAATITANSTHCWTDMEGEVTATGGDVITERGFAWGISPTTCNGTTPSSGYAPPASYTTNWSEHSADFGVGAFDYTANLTCCTTYCYRAYARNSVGYAWGAEYSFLTKPLNPTFTTCVAGSGQAILTWVNAVGGAGITISTVIFYSTVGYPLTITGADGTYSYNSTGLVTTTIGGLTNCTPYYFSAWSQADGCGGQRQYSDNPPAECPATPYGVIVTTKHCTGFGTDWAIVNGQVTLTCAGIGNYTQRGFDYGTTVAYGSESTLEVGVWTTTTAFNALLQSLTPATLYHYRAKVLVGGAWVYGADMTFSTKGSPTLYEYWNTSQNGTNIPIASANWTYQTFTTNITDIAHSVVFINLYMQRVGTLPGDVIVSVRHTANLTTAPCILAPTGDDIVSATLDGDTFSTSYTWYKFIFTEKCLEANTTYAIVVKVPDANTTSYIQWGLTNPGTYAGGNAGFSTNSGSTWTANCTVDQLFEVWGNSCIQIENAKVFTSYVNTGDWLITCLYKNIYEPYYSDGTDVSSMFYIQLVDTTVSPSLLKAQTKCPAYGYRPGSIYLSSTMVSSLEWGRAYSVRLYGDFGAYPYMEYVLQPADWMGSDLTRLDAWVRSAAILIENYYGTTITSMVAGKGIVLNENGGVIFSLGISALSDIRPDVFQIVTTIPGYTQGDYTGAMQHETAWATLLGPKIAGMMTTWGSVFSVSGSTIGALVAFAFYGIVAVFAFPVGHAVAAITIPFGILMVAWYTGLLPLAALGVLLAIAAFFMIWQMVFSRA